MLNEFLEFRLLLAGSGHSQLHLKHEVAPMATSQNSTDGLDPMQSEGFEKRTSSHGNLAAEDGGICLTPIFIEK